MANNIESKSNYSPLILHSDRVLQKMRLNIRKNKRFFETVLLSTHETLHIKGCTLYSESNVSYILFDICGCFGVPGFELSLGFTLRLQLLKRKNSIQTCLAINNTFASSANMSKLLLLRR